VDIREFVSVMSWGCLRGAFCRRGTVPWRAANLKREGLVDVRIEPAIPVD
jgi:hypothetical protein